MDGSKSPLCNSPVGTQGAIGGCALLAIHVTAAQTISAGVARRRIRADAHTITETELFGIDMRAHTHNQAHQFVPDK